ncbi:MAG: Ig domain-containing protein [Actinobacteria bacterium]|nr:Ig domain-containing protein [Actinomycetota bacterium]
MNAPSVVTASLPSANAGVAYSATLNATGGFSPYSWSVSSGSLPGGLSLDPSTGSITGRPVSEGTFKFTVEVSGANSSTTTQDLSIVVGPAPPLACSSTGVGSASYSGGYWIATSTGAVYSCGDAPFYGSLVTAGVTPLKPVVGIAAAPDDKGYYEVASDGGVFAFGPGANFYGSMGGQTLNKPIVGVATTPQGGYYEVASDGGVFSFGPGANFYGSTGCLSLNQPIVGIEVASNTTTVGTETACGSTNPDAPGGYRLIARDGGVFSFGNATFAGSLSGEGVSDVVGAAGA